MSIDKSVKRNSRAGFALLCIFFIFVATLCPITGEMYAVGEAVKADAQASADSKKNTEGENEAEDVTLYQYEKPTVEEESYAWLVFKTIIVLALLVGGFYFFYRFVTKKTGMQSLGRDVIKVLSIVPVGQNKFLQVVDLAGRIMVIGVSDSSINLITEISDRDEIDRIRLLSSKSTPIHPGGFQEYISKYVSKLFKKDNPGTSRSEYSAEPESDRMDYLKRQKDRLKKINGKNDEF
ncbi:MAG: flagellar biosynthetic protein FliO [Spirochaetes bacterium]|nr:flagellar biosynthetic protein FliO [Spirochaetota bacterium]